MRRNHIFLYVLIVSTVIAMACSKRNATPHIVIEIPAGFTGNFVLEMGVRGASPLPQDAQTYVLTVPNSGKLQTSTLLDHPDVAFKNRAQGRVWGYSQRVFTTGDGIAVGGKIEFFVGTQKEFEAEQNKKNTSGGFSQLEPVSAGA
ncbi:MAG TPA: hypothetical protein VMG82_13505 [Candidatus Sulfotelmatobacter sp.]|nr:hypothetical protein [Candidatus Sulfotelmatobacter sp.]